MQAAVYGATTVHDSAQDKSMTVKAFQNAGIVVDFTNIPFAQPHSKTALV